MAIKYRQNHIKAATSYSAWLLYLFSLPYLVSLLTKLIRGELINLALVSTVFVGLVLSALWMSIGLKNKSYYQARKYANNKPFPMMFLASLLVGVCTFVASWLVSSYGLFASIGFGVASIVGCWLWYGLDPVKSKHHSFSDINDSEKALEILQQSETLVINIEKSSAFIDNSEMSSKLESIVEKARKVLKALYENPKKISKARKFLNTYLTGAESVVEKYAQTHKKTQNQELEHDFREVLDNIEEVFIKQHEKLISSDVFDLDVDIEVLNTLLKKQGIK